MRVRNSSAVGSLRKGSDSTSEDESRARVRKKRKRLDAICDDEGGGKRGVAVAGEEDVLELRRSGRVRKAPLILDASPKPARKRRSRDRGRSRLGSSSAKCEVVTDDDDDEEEEEEEEDEEEEEEDDDDEEEERVGWKARLRSTGRNGGVGRGNSNGKRKLFEELDDFVEVLKNETSNFEDDNEDREKEEEAESGNLTAAKTSSSSRSNSSDASRGVLIGVGSCSIQDGEKEMNEVEMVVVNEKENGLHSPVGNDLVNGVEKLCEDGFIDTVVKVVSGSPQLDICVEADEPNSVPLKSIDIEVVETPGNCEGECGVHRVSTDKLGSGKSLVEEEASIDKLDKKVNDDNVAKATTIKCDSRNALKKPYFNEGRQCGLCGVGSDGRPPKRLIHDAADSENEACSEFAASDEPNYDIWDGFGDEPGWLGRLLGPINDRFGITGTWVHQHCAVWSPEVYFAGLGCLKNVRAALCRGRALKCVRCDRRGATIGCRVDRCPKVYHLPCARASGCMFDHRKFLVVCADHRHIFQAQSSHLHQIRKLKAKRMKLELRKTSTEASRKDFEAEEKWMEKCGEDEEFVKREKKRLQRDLLRIAPIYIGGGSESEKEKLFQGWESVAGLEDVVRCMKEVVILPLLYPHFFTNMGLTPPRGVLLHGYPGTGKTLVVRALIGACARGNKKIAYFARKGADCLGKYVGDAERQLRLLFQVAEKSQPSIIFFDEIDGLAPCRTRKQDQTQSSVVSTLLALMDGLKSRGSVIVIGATNRPDSVDPALRRPGRFDREIYFPLPSTKDRSAILSLHTRNWPKPVTGPLLKWISINTAGFAGADLQALCTQAAMIALKRHCPLQEVLSVAAKGSGNACRTPLPPFVVQERDWLEALACAPPPCSRREAGMATNDVECTPLSAHLIPCLMQPLTNLLVALHLDEHLWLPTPLSKAAKMIQSVAVSTLDQLGLPCNYWWSEVGRLSQSREILQELVKKLSSVGELCTGSDVSTAYSNDDTDVLNYSRPHTDCCPAVAHSILHVAGKKAGFRIMICGNPRSGHQHLASCLLNCFIGNVEICKVDLATMAQEGQGDMLVGLTQILKKCSNAELCVLYLPRVDLWALEKHNLRHEDAATIVNDQSVDKEFIVKVTNQSSMIEQAEMEDSPIEGVCASYLWNAFIEQVDTICISTSLMILSTSEVPYAELPSRVSQFFNIGELKWRKSSVRILPRYVVQIDGKFHHDVVISSAAAKLSKDIVQLNVELIYNRTHPQTIQREDLELCTSLEGNVGAFTGNASHHIAHDYLHKTQLFEETRGLPVQSLGSLNGKPNTLLIAISTLGHQILLYPHFAELNWVTSKLKDGPCADIRGPWKAWPFNFCIARPLNSKENDGISCSPNMNSKKSESYSLVRGLTAVGLSAYRGLYSSIREVSSDVRKVLELLVKLINAKIEGGKDQYKFVRLLSQVAYFEDMVTNWAYTFRSLELGPNAATEATELPVSAPTAETAADEVVGEAIVSIQCETPKILNDHDLTCEEVPETGVDMPSRDVLHTSVMPETAETDGSILRKKNGDEWKMCGTENMVKVTVANGYVDPSIQSNGFLFPVPVDVSSDGTQASAQHDTPLKNSLNTSENCESQRNTYAPLARKHGITAVEEIMCFYYCCRKCTRTLYTLMQKLMMQKLEESGSNWTFEDVHDTVGSLSVKLMSSFKASYLTENSRRGQKNSPGCHHVEGKNPKTIVEPQDCVCCDDSASSPGSYLKPELDMKFMYQDGVLIPIDTNKDITYHCKFDTLCLCSLIEWVSAATKSV